jgi:hypothetical protein
VAVRRRWPAFPSRAVSSANAMDPVLEWLWNGANKAGPFASMLALLWGFSQYRRAEAERKERLSLQELIYGKEGVAGILERVVAALNASTTSINSMNEAVRPLLNAVIEKMAGGK